MLTLSSASRDIRVLLFERIWVFIRIHTSLVEETVGLELG